MVAEGEGGKQDGERSADGAVAGRTGAADGSGGRTGARGRTRRRRWWGLPLALVLVVALGAVWFRLRYGGGEPFPSRSGEPERTGDGIEVLAALDHPPAGIAVSPAGRLFVTFHPASSPPIKLAEIVDHQPVPYPDARLQRPRDAGPWLEAPLGLRLDNRGRLWVLDAGRQGRGDPKLVAIDTKTAAVVREQHLSPEQAPLGSYLSDLAVHPEGDRVYLADASVLRQRPALLVYDLRTGRMRRVLQGRADLAAGPYRITIDGEPVARFGLFSLRPGVSSLALDATGAWLYFAAAAADELYRIPTSALDDESLDDEKLASRIEVVGKKTVASALWWAPNGSILMGDPEHHALARLAADGTLHTWLQDARLRWPAGLCRGADAQLYLTASALGQLALQGEDAVAPHAPYLVLRVPLGELGKQVRQPRSRYPRKPHR